MITYCNDMQSIIQKALPIKHKSYKLFITRTYVIFRKKVEMNINNHTSHHSSMVTKPLSTSKKKRSTPKAAKTNNTPIVSTFIFHV